MPSQSRYSNEEITSIESPPPTIIDIPPIPTYSSSSSSSNANHQPTPPTNVFFNIMQYRCYGCHGNTYNYYPPKKSSLQALNKNLFAFTVQCIATLLALCFSSSSSSSSSASYSTKVLTMSTIVLFCSSLISTAMVLPLKFQRLAQAISYLSAILAFISMSTILLNSRDYYWLFLFLIGTFLLLFLCNILFKKLPPVFTFKNLFSIRFVGNQPLQNDQMRLRIIEEDGDDAVI